MKCLLDQVGGTQFVNQTVSEFYQVIGRQLSSFEACDHKKQQSRQAQFINHALSAQPEPVLSHRANFLARGLNPALFEALLEYIEARLLELGFSWQLSKQLVKTAGGLYDRCEQHLSIAC
ncbi:globin family protein [Microbulbifer thermotolerans]|uniref:Uncharacterized protein n=1 Tax=Microbulbifer thermotolerans TaxID=252514 RepID=A0A143HM41_MICTH|nr:hypothetical protein [Microbulbifer thermotolerans]AMX02753.1 hypothetical protein A3224_09290 [Microbulbifer thermotolerans]MCX2782574.1 hypothetical protein [Microbulbifer thermotolerans]MCX2794586.1 hypothetical protein [Microbulbifer thermotolerans]MCX2801414.1 hypothetical protein [Microbulbifer thermotolerans]MCX2831675.1 hypothetical protein [Microbulbifer thermotolerans]